MAFPVESVRRFNKIDGKHLALVIAMNLFVAVIPLIMSSLSWPGRGSPQAGAGRRRHFSWRALVSIVLIVLGCILTPVAVIGVWVGNEVSDTGRYVATVEPLIHDPAIQNYLAGQITTQITSHLNITGTINQASAQLNGKGLPRISSLLTTFGPQIASSGRPPRKWRPGRGPSHRQKSGFRPLFSPGGRN